MLGRSIQAVLLAAVIAVAGACANSSTRDGSPTTATPADGIDYFVGAWTSTPPATSISINGTPTDCSSLDYTITKIDSNTGSVRYDLVCAGYSVKGIGSAALQGSVLKWTASGTVSGGGINCPFAFSDNTATAQPDDRILVTFNATVCGVGPFGGSRLLQRK